MASSRAASSGLPVGEASKARPLRDGERLRELEDAVRRLADMGDDWDGLPPGAALLFRIGVDRDDVAVRILLEGDDGEAALHRVSVAAVERVLSPGRIDFERADDVV